VQGSNIVEAPEIFSFESGTPQLAGAGASPAGQISFFRMSRIKKGKVTP